MTPLLLTAWLLQANPATSAQVSHESFAELSERFIHESLARSPISASVAGYHLHVDPTTHATVALDGLLDDVSAAGVAGNRAFYERWRTRFQAPELAASLDAESRVDLGMLRNAIDQTLFELRDVESFRHEPTQYVEELGDALFLPLTVDYAPKERRLGHVLARIAQIPRFLAQAKATLKSADPIFIKVAVEENKGNVDLIEHAVTNAIPRGSPQAAELERVGPPAIAALKAFSTWLAQDLARSPDGSWRLGPERYARKFALVAGSEVTPEKLLADARDEVKRVRAQMLELALPMHRKLFPGHGDHDALGAAREDTVLREVLGKIADEHPARDGLLEAVKNDLAETRAFIREKHIVSLSPNSNLKVIPTPLFMRGIFSVAGFQGPPPLDPGTEAQFWVTPIDPSVPEAKAESKLREYNSWTLRWLVIHEALPGHYVQYEHANGVQPPTRRVLRSLYGSGPYIEGWAEYVAQVMLKAGFANGDARYRLSYLKVWLRALVNSILDVSLHTQHMGDADALALMEKVAFQTQAEAEGKLQRAKLSSVQLTTYFLGTRAWWRLRNAVESAQGKKFDLEKFHDRALDEGAVPLQSLETLVH